jgi:hypothetical protein
MEKVGIFVGHLVYIAAIWYISWPFGNLVAIVVYFPIFWYIVSRKSGNPASNTLQNQLISLFDVRQCA